MLWRIMADLILLIHLAFILFVLFGGFLAIGWRWIPWIHLPAVLWGVALEFGGWICPLTPLENWLRQAGGGAGYSGGFIEHYALPVIYPEGLTPQIQFFLGVFLILMNLLAYGLVWRHRASQEATLD